MSNNGIYRVVKAMLARNNILGSPHTLRHGYGTALTLKGCDAHTIMRLMRHRTLKEAIRYIHMAEPHLAERQRKFCPLDLVKHSQGKAPFVKHTTIRLLGSNKQYRIEERIIGRYHYD